MSSASEVADRELLYRGFRIKVGASVRFGGILVAASLTGGPDGIARQFGLSSTERDVNCACAMALHDLRKVVDDLLDGRPRPPGAAPVRDRVTAMAPHDDEGGPFEA